jgi:hypothetical protein
MTQVYQFVDDNGVTRLFAEIVPDPAGASPPVSFTAGLGSPNGIVTEPEGSLYVDTLDGGVYINQDGTNTGWVSIGGGADANNATDNGYPVGVSDHATGRTFLLATAGKYAYVGDSAAANGTGGGLYWNDLAAADGAQRLAAVTGSTGQFIGVVQDAAGQMRPVVLVLTNHSAPADGTIAAGDCALWFDQTNGAAKLMVKAKQADGTVRTGSLALT